MDGFSFRFLGWIGFLVTSIFSDTFLIFGRSLFVIFLLKTPFVSQGSVLGPILFSLFYFYYYKRRTTLV